MKLVRAEVRLTASRLAVDIVAHFGQRLSAPDDFVGRGPQAQVAGAGIHKKAG